MRLTPDSHTRKRHLQVPPPAGACEKASVRRLDRSAPTGVNYGFPMAVLAMLLAEPKASQSLPALQAPDSVRCSRRPRGGGPEVPFVVLCLQPCQR